MWSLWRNWAIAAGAPVLAIALSLKIGMLWLPLVLFGLELFIYTQIRLNRDAALPVCFLTPFVMTRILFWSALTMLILGLCSTHGLYDRWFDVYDPAVPYLPVMVIGPVASVISGWAVIRKFNFGFCVECRMRLGTPAERGFMGRLFSQEGRFQVKFMLWFSVIITVVAYVYYFTTYINAGLSSSDKYFFVWLPVIFYITSLIFIGTRYFNLWAYYDHNIVGTDIGKGSSTSIRFLIFTKTKIYLTDDADLGRDYKSDDLYDTPASLTIPLRRDITLEEATRFFRELSDIERFNIRFMYLSKTSDGEANAFHYIVTLDDEAITSQSKLEGQWFDMYRLEKLLNSERLIPLLASEIYRLYTVTLSWKTYDRYGRRRYRIKNYHPTFRLRDIVNPEIDFNDPQWLNVATNNEDKPFYILKRFWRKYINGIKE